MAKKEKVLNIETKRKIVESSIWLVVLIVSGIFIVLFAKSIIGGTLVDLASTL